MAFVKPTLNGKYLLWRYQITFFIFLAPHGYIKTLEITLNEFKMYRTTLTLSESQKSISNVIFS